MTERFDVKKEIEDLAIMTNCSFNALFNMNGSMSENIDVLKDDVQELKSDVYELKNNVTELNVNMLELRADTVDLKEEVSGMKINLKSVNQKLDLIIENMVTRNEFESAR